jgi:hypothetical protein
MFWIILSLLDSMAYIGIRKVPECSKKAISRLQPIHLYSVSWNYLIGQKTHNSNRTYAKLQYMASAGRYGDTARRVKVSWKRASVTGCDNNLTRAGSIWIIACSEMDMTESNFLATLHFHIRQNTPVMLNRRSVLNSDSKVTRRPSATCLALFRMI